METVKARPWKGGQEATWTAACDEDRPLALNVHGMLSTKNTFRYGLNIELH